MQKIALLLALGALCVVGAEKFTGSRTADMDFLHKQKKIYELLFYVRQNDLIDAEFYEIGRSYNIESNMNMYNDESCVQKCIWYYKQDLLLKRDATFSVYNREHVEEMELLFDLLYSAKDFQTFYKTACWARIHMNSGLFATAFSVAVFYRNDCKYMQLPPIYEVYPNLFFDSNVIQKAQNIKMTRGMSGMPAIGNLETYMIFANYSSASLMPGKGIERKLDYFMEDVGLNSFYFYFRQAFPFWLNTRRVEIPKNVRGDLYYFVHQQLLARYYLERMSNDLGDISDFDWHKPIFPGFFSMMSYSNGIPIPQRIPYSSVPFYKFKYIKEINALEKRIMDAIDLGYLIDEQGKQVNIYVPEGLNMIANMIEGNVDSCNRRFYGMYDALARDILGFSFNVRNKNNEVPSALETHCTSMRDPAFYMLYKRIMSYFMRYKRNLPQYTQAELQLPGVKIESVNVDKLVTFFDNCDTLINNAVQVENLKTGMSLRMKARRPCLNYQPFTYRLNVNADKEMKAIVRIFLGPVVPGMDVNELYLSKFYNAFYKLDMFQVDLRAGSNTIERSSSDSVLTMPDMMSSDVFYDKLNKAISGSQPFMYSEKIIAYSERLTLPRGKPEGMRFKMLFFLSPYDESSAKMVDVPLFGKIMLGGKPVGFPLDRPTDTWNYTIPNMYFKDVLIYEKEMKY